MQPFKKKGWKLTLKQRCGAKLITIFNMDIKVVMIIMVRKLGIRVIERGNLIGGRQPRQRARRGRVKVSIVSDLDERRRSNRIT